LYFDTREPGIKNTVEFYCEYLALVHSRPEAAPEFNKGRFLVENQLTPGQLLDEADNCIGTITSNRGSFLQVGIRIDDAYFQRYLAAWRYFKDGGQEAFCKPWQDAVDRLSIVDAGKAAVLVALRSILLDAPDVNDRGSIEARVTEALTKAWIPPGKNDCSIYHIDYDF
jgi:hypothetical protein